MYVLIELWYYALNRGRVLSCTLDAGKPVQLTIKHVDDCEFAVIQHSFIFNVQI